MHWVVPPLQPSAPIYTTFTYLHHLNLFAPLEPICTTCLYVSNSKMSTNTETVMLSKEVLCHSPLCSHYTLHWRECTVHWRKSTFNDTAPTLERGHSHPWSDSPLHFRSWILQNNTILTTIKTYTYTSELRILNEFPLCLWCIFALQALWQKWVCTRRVSWLSRTEVAFHWGHLHTGDVM